MLTVHMLTFCLFFINKAKLLQLARYHYYRLDINYYKSKYLWNHDLIQTSARQETNTGKQEANNNNQCYNNKN